VTVDRADGLCFIDCQRDRLRRHSRAAEKLGRGRHGYMPCEFAVTIISDELVYGRHVFRLLERRLKGPK
jgi:hypothetical protein